MISIKHLVAAIALGTALVAAPGVATAKVTHNTPTKVIHKNHKKKHNSHKKTLATHKHAKGKPLTAHKTTSHNTAAGWKHHRSV